MMLRSLKSPRRAPPPTRASRSFAWMSPIALPSSAEAARAAEAATGFPGGDRAPAILVVTRGDGAVLAPEDLGAAEAACPYGLPVAELIQEADRRLS